MNDEPETEGAEDLADALSGGETGAGAAGPEEGEGQAAPVSPGEDAEPPAPADTVGREDSPDDELWADGLVDDIQDTGPSQTALELLDELGRCIYQRDKASFVRTAVEAVTSERLSIPELYGDVLAPLLIQMGAEWQRGRVTVWEEHLATAMVRTVVEILYPGVLKIKAAAPSAERSVLLASPPEEAHDLGLRMLSDRFDMAGWTTYFLGADSPVDAIVDAARKLNVDAVVLSSATHFHRLALRAFVDRLRNELAHVHVWVGGSAFAHDAEGWASYEVRDVEALLAEFPAPPEGPGSE